MVTINLTTNLHLQKPTSDEKYSVQTQNTNMDILDTTIKTLQDKDATLTKQTDFESHTNNKNNPHTVTKEQLGLSNVVNQRQIPAIQTAVTDGGVPVFDGNGYTLKDSGFTIEKSVPAEAKFTDTIYTHPSSGVVPDTYNKVWVDVNGHVVGGSNPTTLDGYGITDAEPLGSATNALTEAKDYSDSTYMQTTGYTDNKVAELINGAPSTLDTLKEIADAMEENQSVVESLEVAIGNKANEVEFQSHQNNTTVHVTASQTGKWDNYETDITTINQNLTVHNPTFIPNAAGLTASNITCRTYGKICVMYGTFTPNQSGSGLALGTVPMLPPNNTVFNITTFAGASASYGYIRSTDGTFICHIQPAMVGESCAINATFLSQ